MSFSHLPIEIISLIIDNVLDIDALLMWRLSVSRQIWKLVEAKWPSAFRKQLIATGEQRSVIPIDSAVPALLPGTLHEYIGQPYVSIREVYRDFILRVEQQTRYRDNRSMTNKISLCFGRKGINWQHDPDSDKWEATKVYNRYSEDKHTHLTESVKHYWIRRAEEILITVFPELTGAFTQPSCLV